LLSVAWLFAMAGCAVRPPVAAIATAHPLATQAGMEILAAGGNAFDAAVGVSAALAVVEPYSSGIGGGGFWLLHRARDGYEVMVDGRETAPLAASRDMYLDGDGNVVPGLSVDGALAAGIPGEPAALVHIAARYGRLPLGHSLAPAIRLARHGFEVDGHYRRLAQFRLAALQDDLEATRIYLRRDDVPEEGARILQPDLGDTLTALARFGRAGFYHGPVAERLVAGVRAASVPARTSSCPMWLKVGMPRWPRPSMNCLRRAGSRRGVLARNTASTSSPTPARAVSTLSVTGR